MKAIIFLTSISIIFNSCSGNRFLNRKYTSGRFFEKKRLLKHNTIFCDTAAVYSSSADKTELKKIPVSPEHYSEIAIAVKPAPIAKKDSIFIRAKKGKDQRTVKKNDLDYDVITLINKKGAVVSQKIQAHATIDPEIKNNPGYKEIKSLSIWALAFSWVPVLGLVLAIRFKKKLKKYKAAYPTENLHNYSGRSTLAITISTIMSSVVIGLILGFLIILSFVLLLTL